MECQMTIAVTTNFGMNRSQPLRDILAAMTPINPSIITIMKIETRTRATPENRDQDPSDAVIRQPRENNPPDEIERNHQTDDGENEPHHENLSPVIAAVTTMSI